MDTGCRRLLQKNSDQEGMLPTFEGKRAGSKRSSSRSFGFKAVSLINVVHEMKLIKFSKVICVNNEIQGHSAKNLLNTEIDPKKSWLCEKGTQRGIVLLQLECPTVITAVRIGNAHSAFVEVLVGNVGDPTDKYQTLIPPSLFMNCYDAKSGTNPDQVKFFYQKDLSPAASGKEWSALQIVCTQPFNDKVPFGICFVRVTGLGDELEVVEEKKEEYAQPLPSTFSKEIPTKEEKKLTVAEEILKAGKSSARMKAASIKSKVSPEGTIRKDAGEKDLPDNRRNKNFGFEQTPKKRKKSPEESASPDNKKDGRRESGRKKRKSPTDSRPFSRLMDDVMFVISGFKNPERSDIRNLALKMGARYSSDWNSRCTHLICSYMNTPKYNEVKGKGHIVKKDWVIDCHNDRKRYPWRRYALNPDDRKAEESEEEVPAREVDSSEEEVEGEEAAAETKTERTGRRSTRKPQEKKQAREDGDMTETDEEQRERPDTTELPMPHLPDLLAGKTFYVDRNLESCALVERYIVAYNGNIADTVEEGVEFYVTEKAGDVLGIFRKKVPKMRAVRPSWIWEINSKGQWVSPWKFMISA